MNRKTGTRVLLALCIASLAACGDKYNPEATIRTDSSGIEIIANTGNYHPLTWAFDTAFTISAIGDSAFQRVRPHTIAVSRDGLIYILDTTTRRIDIHDATGKVIATVPPGAGGKLSMPSALVLQPDGFAVYDADKDALVHFAADGKYISTALAPRQFREGVLRSDSDALVMEQHFVDPKTDSLAISIVRVSKTDSTSLIAAHLDDELNVQFPMCGVTIALAPMFGEPPAWDARNGITAVAEAPLWGVRMYRSGKEYRRVRRKLSPEAANNQYAFLAAGAGKEVRLPNGTVCTIPPAEIAKGAGWKSIIPAIGAILIAPDGGLWLQRVDPGHYHPAVDVIDGKGEYVGTLPLNTPWPLGFLPNGNPVSLTEDTAGVSHIIAYRINKNPPPVVPGKDAKR